MLVLQILQLQHDIYLPVFFITLDELIVYLGKGRFCWEVVKEVGTLICSQSQAILQYGYCIRVFQYTLKQDIHLSHVWWYGVCNTKGAEILLVVAEDFGLLPQVCVNFL